MLSNLEALAALAEHGTMTKAALRLRVGQSAVSKRVAALADEVGVPLIEPDGRRVRLTIAGRELLSRVAPLLAELRHALGGTQAEAGGTVSIGVAHSVLASWGPKALARAKDKIDGLELAIHSHRSTVAVERVQAGEYQLGIAAGVIDASDLSRIVLGREPMVIVPSGKKPRLARGRELTLLTIEPSSGTWRDIAPQLSVFQRERGVTFRVAQTVETFACSIQMARVGFGHAMVPKGIARTYGVREYVELPSVAREVALVGRRMTLSRPLASRLAAELQSASRGILGRL